MRLKHDIFYYNPKKAGTLNRIPALFPRLTEESDAYLSLLARNSSMNLVSNWPARKPGSAKIA